MKTKNYVGILFITFPLIVQIPFGILVSTFNYPDVLRESPGIILDNFFKGGAPLQSTWYFYAVSILIFLLGVLSHNKIANLEIRNINKIALVSGVLQMIALLRWSFLVPILAKNYYLTSDPAVKKAIEVLFEIQNSFFGIAIGEHLGQFTMATWTLLLSKKLAPNFKVTKYLGFLSGGVLAAGLTEHVVTTFNRPLQGLDMIAAVGFVLWSVWMIVFGIQFIKQKKSEDLWLMLDK